jgi:hypothetical protein
MKHDFLVELKSQKQGVSMSKFGQTFIYIFILIAGLEITLISSVFANPYCCSWVQRSNGQNVGAILTVDYFTTRAQIQQDYSCGGYCELPMSGNRDGVLPGTCQASTTPIFYGKNVVGYECVCQIDM